jgi:hypothetical protein
MDMDMESASSVIEDELEWEEWDGQTPFWTHCVAGGLAGVAEHTLLYPVDTVKTHMQSYCADCPHNPATPTATTSAAQASNSSNALAQQASSVIKGASRAQIATSATTTVQASAEAGMWKTMNRLVYTTAGADTALMEAPTTAAAQVVKNCAKEAAATAPVMAKANIARLWTGVQTMMVGCAPAHALYFSSYELVKLYTDTHTTHGTTPHHLGNMAAGAAATTMHDCIMTPLDTMKQRLQLGYYKGSMSTAFIEMVRLEGFAGLYRSFGAYTTI